MLLPLPLAGVDIIFESFFLSDGLGKFIVVLLVLFSVLAWTIIIQKLLTLRHIRAKDAQFVHTFDKQQHPLQLYVEQQASGGGGGSRGAFSGWRTWGRARRRSVSSRRGFGATGGRWRPSTSAARCCR